LICLNVHHLNYVYNNKNLFDGYLAVWKTPNDGLMDDGLMDGGVCFLPRNYPLLLLGRIVSYRETRGALWLPEFRVDQLYFGGRERAPGEFSEMLQAGIEIQP